MNTIAEKVAHVRAARQTRPHKCHWPGCKEIVPPARFSCLAHWRRLPQHLRNRIWAAYRVGQEDDMRPSAAYIEAVKAVRDWIAEHYPTTATEPRSLFGADDP